MRVDRPQQDCDGVGFVVVGGVEAAIADSVDDRSLVGVALAGDVTLDRPDRHAFVRNTVLLAPGGRGLRESRRRYARRRCPRDGAPPRSTRRNCRAASLATMSSQPRSVGSACRRRHIGLGETTWCRSQSRRRRAEWPNRASSPDQGRGRLRCAALAPVPNRVAYSYPTQPERTSSKPCGSPSGRLADQNGISSPVSQLIGDFGGYR